MSLFLTIVFSLFGLFCLIGIVGEPCKERRWEFTICFSVCAAFILAVNILGGTI